MLPDPSFEPLAAAVGFLDRYTAYVQRNGCSHCGTGPLLRAGGHRSCMVCGWAGRTYAPTAERIAVAEGALFICEGSRRNSTEDYAAAAVDLWDRGYSLGAIAQRLGAA